MSKSQQRLGHAAETNNPNSHGHNTTNLFLTPAEYLGRVIPGSRLLEQPLSGEPLVTLAEAKGVWLTGSWEVKFLTRGDVHYFSPAKASRMSKPIPTGLGKCSPVTQPGGEREILGRQHE